MALKDLIKNRDLVIQIADKDNAVIILNKHDYISTMKVTFGDSPKIQKLSIDQNKVLNHIRHMKNRIIDVLKKLKKKKIISEKKYEDLYPVGSSPRISYSRAKIHEPIKGGVPSFCAILSVIGTPTYKLSNFFAPLLTPLTLKEYTIKHSFLFAEELLNYDSNLVMASFDVESLFTNVHFQEAIDFCVELLLNDKPTLKVLP